MSSALLQLVGPPGKIKTALAFLAMIIHRTCCSPVIFASRGTRATDHCSIGREDNFSRLELSGCYFFIAVLFAVLLGKKL